MRQVRISLVGTLVFVLFAATASAQATRTWVSGVGDDANPCSRTAPCKTFAGAISKTATCGEISVLDPGGFGAVTITKSITINGTGTLAGILAAGSNGVVINIAGGAAATCGGRVHLINLSINGVGTGLVGVKVLAAGEVTVQGLDIYAMTGNTNSHGISVENTTANAKLNVIDTVIRASAGQGILLNGTGFDVFATLNNVRVIDGLRNGLALTSRAKAVVQNCQFTGNVNSGVFVADAASEVAVYDSVMARNGNGVNVGSSGGGTVRLYGSEITQNTTNGILIAGAGVVSTHQNNAIIGNSGAQATNNNAGVQ